MVGKTQLTQVTSSDRGLDYKDMCDNKINRIFSHATRPHKKLRTLSVTSQDKGWTERVYDWYLLRIRPFITTNDVTYVSQLVACFNISCLWLTLISLVIVEYLTGSQGFRLLLAGCRKAFITLAMLKFKGVGVGSFSLWQVDCRSRRGGTGRSGCLWKLCP